LTTIRLIERVDGGQAGGRLPSGIRALSERRGHAFRIAAAQAAGENCCMSNRSEQEARNRRYTDAEVRLLLEQASRVHRRHAGSDSVRTSSGVRPAECDP
jgi:hypothetical protein